MKAGIVPTDNFFMAAFEIFQGVDAAASSSFLAPTVRPTRSKSTFCIRRKKMRRERARRWATVTAAAPRCPRVPKVAAAAAAWRQVQLTTHWWEWVGHTREWKRDEWVKWMRDEMVVASPALQTHARTPIQVQINFSSGERECLRACLRERVREKERCNWDTWKEWMIKKLAGFILGEAQSQTHHSK